MVGWRVGGCSIKFGHGDGWLCVTIHENMFVLNATAEDYYPTETDIRFYSNDTQEESIFAAHFFLFFIDVLFYALTATVVISVIALCFVKCFLLVFPVRRALL